MARSRSPGQSAYAPLATADADVTLQDTNVSRIVGESDYAGWERGL